jgi:hypothetical protein
MPRKSIKPNFKSEAEEAAWYATPEGRRQTRREYEKALKEGTVIRSGGVDENVLRQLMEQAKERATRAISIRLSVADIERAQAIATQQGIGYQTVLKKVIHNGLKKAG